MTEHPLAIFYCHYSLLFATPLRAPEVLSSLQFYFSTLHISLNLPKSIAITILFSKNILRKKKNPPCMANFLAAAAPPPQCLNSGVHRVSTTKQRFIGSGGLLRLHLPLFAFPAVYRRHSESTRLESPGCCYSSPLPDLVS